MKKKLYFVVFSSPVHRTLYDLSFDYDCVCFETKKLLNVWKKHSSDFILSTIVCEFTKIIEV